jgi:hypothetical protein
MIGKSSGEAAKLKKIKLKTRGIDAFFRPHSILHQGSTVCKQFENKSLIDALIKPANCICRSALNDPELAALLEEVAIECGVIIRRASLRWLIL